MADLAILQMTTPCSWRCMPGTMRQLVYDIPLAAPLLISRT